MSNYLVLLASRNVLKIVPDGACIPLLDSVISIRPISDNRDRELSYLRRGWLIEVHLAAKNVDEAIKKAYELSEFFLSVCCMESGFHVHNSKLILIYDTTPDIEERFLRQYFYEFPSTVFNSEIEHKKLTIQTKAISEYDSKYRSRIFRAIRWFRKGITSSDTLDQFLFFWHGLETLNSPLAEAYKKEKSLKKNIKRQCKACNEFYEDTIHVKGGIEALYDDMKVDDRCRKEINDIRNKISHGYDDIYPLSKRAYDILPLIARILYYAINTVIGLNLSHKTWNNLVGTAPSKIDDYIALNTIIMEKDISKVGVNGYFPRFILRIKGNQITPINKTGCGGKTLGFIGSGRDVTLHLNELE